MFINPQSEYYSVSNLSNIFNSTKGKGISLVHCNIRSLTKTLTPLNDTLYSLDSRLDIIAVTETRLSSNPISNLDVPNYEGLSGSKFSFPVFIFCFTIPSLCYARVMCCFIFRLSTVCCALLLFCCFTTMFCPSALTF